MTMQDNNSEASNKTLLRQSASEWSLKANDEGADGQIFPILSEHYVGREDCEIMLTNPHSSRRHAKLNLNNGVLQVEDLNSANGTFVNGEKIVLAVLKDGDIVRFDLQEYTIIGPKDAAKTMVRPMSEPKKEIKKTPRKKATNKKTPRKKATTKKTPRKKVIAKKAPSTDPHLVEASTTASPTVEVPVSIDDLNEAVDEKAIKEVTDQGKTLLATRKVESSDLQAQSDGGVTRVVPMTKRVAMPSLVGTTGAWADKVIQLSGKAMTIGRTGVDISLDDPSVSTKHAQIIMQENKWKVVDLMSANGIYVNGKKTQASFLNPGDMIRFGRLELRFMTEEVDNVSTEFTGEEQTEKGQIIKSIGEKFSNKVPSWLYVAIGFFFVLAIGFYVLSLK